MKTRLLISAMLICAATSCTRTVYTPVVSTASDSLYSASIWRDTLYLLDSVRVELRGDSVKEARTRTLYRTVIRIDTVREAITDTIRITLPPESKKGDASRWRLPVIIALTSILCLGIFRRVTKG